MRMENKVVLISGASRGLGATQAKMLANEGASVIVGDILEAEGNMIVEQMATENKHALFVYLDVTKSSSWNECMTKSINRFGKVDVLINNAGISATGDILGTSEETWDRIMEVNAKGVFLGTRAVLPHMINRRTGSIVNISSQMGLVGTDTSNPAYQASKAAVHIFTKSTAVRHAKDGIRANSIHPGPIKTPMLDETSIEPGRLEKVLSGVPLNRIGTPAEVGYGVIFLASDESSYITGSALIIDGGYLAR
ncbi:glucose 1-dehydrogenase [SAR202 cluster bacterium AC-409-J13_OGT_754m]|nr:glucose 1-dehydrogenase [SAR202 cluster bacterium AC-409-J13_OGT_754m]